MKIRIGKNKEGNEIYFNYDSRYGNRTFLILGLSRTGKSSLTKNIIMQLSQEYPCIIFDSYQNEYGLLKFPNLLSKLPKCTGRIKTYDVEKLGFYLKDFSSNDYRLLNMPRMTSIWLSRLAKLNYYNDDPQTFMDSIQELPYDKRTAEKFKKKYSVEIPGYIPSRVIPNLENFEVSLGGLLISPADINKTRLTRQDLINDINEGYSIQFNFHLEDYYLSERQRLVMAGRLLSLLSSENTMNQLARKPVFFIEEADHIFPQWTAMENIIPTSNKTGILMTKKLMRFGMGLFIITQNPKSLDQNIWNDIKYRLYSILGDDAPMEMKEKTKYLKWDVGKNYREFIFEELGTPLSIVFTPDELGCLTPQMTL